MRVEGRWLVDEQGRVVVLHGVNLVNKLPPYEPLALGFDAAHARFLAEAGFTTVRLGIIHKALEPSPGEYDHAYLDRIAECAGLLRDHGIHVLVDFHQDMLNERFGGQGEPDWAVTGGPPPWPDVAFPHNYFLMPALWLAYDRFWQNAGGVQDRFAAAWRAAAERLRGVAFAYDLFNEPFPGTRAILAARPGGDPRFDRALRRFHAKCLAAIREADDEAVVFCEPNVLFNTGSHTHHGPLDDPNTGFSFHCYCQLQTPGLPRARGDAAARWCTRAERRVFRHAQEQGSGALLLSEFGALDDLAAVARTADLADEARVSWQYWAYWNADPCCARPEEGLVHALDRPPTPDNVKQGKLRVLARPYPRAVAGTPERWRWVAEASTFVLECSARDGVADGAVTEIACPPVAFPRGYRAAVEGGEAVSAPGEPVLRVRPAAGAARTVVAVAPLP